MQKEIIANVTAIRNYRSNFMSPLSAAQQYNILLMQGYLNCSCFNNVLYIHAQRNEDGFKVHLFLGSLLNIQCRSL